MIYILRDRHPGSCPYESALAHERKHQAADEAALAEHRTAPSWRLCPRTRRCIVESLRNMSPIVLTNAQLDIGITPSRPETNV